MDLGWAARLKVRLSVRRTAQPLDGSLARPTLNSGVRQEVVSDTFQFGLFTTAGGTWGHTYGSAAAPADLGDDFDTGLWRSTNGRISCKERLEMGASPST